MTVEQAALVLALTALAVAAAAYLRTLDRPDVETASVEFEFDGFRTERPLSPAAAARLGAELAANRARREDPRLAVIVRERDGDRCRWCATSVTWQGRRSGRSGVLDYLGHLAPGSLSARTFVVACRACNDGRAEDPTGWSTAVLLPPPAHPVYSIATAEFLSRHGVWVGEAR